VIADVFAAVQALGWWLAIWILTLSAVLTVLLLATVAGMAWTVRAAWRALGAGVRAAHAVHDLRATADAHRPSQAPPRPAWARTGKDAA